MIDQRTPKPIKHFTVPPPLFDTVVRYLMTQPYSQVSDLIYSLQSDCKAVFEDALKEPASDQCGDASLDNQSQED